MGSHARRAGRSGDVSPRQSCHGPLRRLPATMAGVTAACGCTPRRRTTVVVGAGILGLAVARELLRRDPAAAVTVLEAADHLGPASRGTTAASCTPASTTSRARSRPRCAAAAWVCCATSAPSTASPTASSARSSSPRPTDEVAGWTGSRSGRGATRCPAWPVSTGAACARSSRTSRGLAALHSPRTAVVDYAAVCRALADDVRAAGGVVRLGVAGQAVHPTGDRPQVGWPSDPAGATARRRPAGGLRRSAQRRSGGEWGPARRTGRRADRAVPRRVPPAGASGRATRCAAWSIRCRTRATRSSAST